MAEDDIYGNKSKYEAFKKNLQNFMQPPTPEDYRKKYYCKNPINLQYFEKLFRHFDTQDISYVRRNRVLSTFKVICHCITKDLSDASREDINQVVAFAHQANKTVKSKGDFIRDLKVLWKCLFPEKDERGNIDNTLVPYPVRHLKNKIEKSKERLRGDRLTLEEFEQISTYFANDQRIRAYLHLSFESLSRPQEILYTKIKDVEVYDNYAKIWISEHGKTGTGFMQCIDSYPHIARWLEKHPLRHNKNAFLFINLGGKVGSQLTPININKKLRQACKSLNIDKPITCYSLKRNGVTYRRLRGDSDVDIQHAARWTSTKQIRTYDMTTQQDVFQKELAKRGLVKDQKYTHLLPQEKKCFFCEKENCFDAITCTNCRRPLDRESINRDIENKEQEITKLYAEMQKFRTEVINMVYAKLEKT